MKYYLSCILSLVTLLSLSANNNLRHWNFTNDTQIHAELVDYNETEDQVYLRVKETEDYYLSLEEFSALDQAWLVEWTRMSDKLDNQLKETPGTFTAYQYQGALDTHDFYVYEPSSVQGSSNRPLMILISAGPKGMRYLLRHIGAAEATGMTIVAMDRVGNTHTDEATQSTRARFTELLPQIEATVPHDPQQLYLGGTSGGALRAMRWVNHFDRNWQGVYWNGGWLGYQADLLESYRPMKVIVVNGNNDRAANNMLRKRDLDIMLNNEIEVGIIAFEGGHQIPPVEHQIMAFEWLLDSESVESLSTLNDLQPPPAPKFPE